MTRGAKLFFSFAFGASALLVVTGAWITWISVNPMIVVLASGIVGLSATLAAFVGHRRWARTRPAESAASYPQ